jgi:hypothetical protein
MIEKRGTAVWDSGPRKIFWHFDYVLYRSSIKAFLGRLFEVRVPEDSRRSC